MLDDLTKLYIVTVCGSSGFALTLMLISSIASKWEDRRAIRRARTAEIGEGVTLLRGIRACFGEDGLWSVWMPGLVHVYVGDPRLIFVVEVIPGWGRTYRAIPQLADQNHHWAGMDERDVAFGVMVEAVKEQEMMIEV